MHRRCRLGWLALVALLAIGIVAPLASAAPAKVPAGFFGVVPQGRLEARDFDRMSGLGLTLRFPVFWSEVEPQPGRYELSELDRIVAEAARTGVRVMPAIYGTPAWLAADPATPPLGAKRLARWRALLARLVERYGPRGEFWNDRVAAAPLRRWQIWNEPNFPLFWRPRPSPRGYARLLHASATTIRRLDPGARIVAAGVAPIERQIRPWEFLRRLYRMPGARHDFDVVALHPYASSLAGVEYEIRRTRKVMAESGEGRAPLLLSEVGVASGGRYPTPFDHGRSGQARFLERAFARLASQRRQWRLAGVAWFAWQDGPVADAYCVFCEFAGLFDRTGKPKPSWRSFRRVVAGSVSSPVR